MNNEGIKNSLLTDIYLLLFLALMLLTVIFVSLTNHIFYNTVFASITVTLILITYFQGIFWGLVSNLTFIFVQVFMILYSNIWLHHAIPIDLSFWLINPILLSITFYGITFEQQKLQKSNQKLQTSLMKREAFDNQTHIRNIGAFLEDARVFIENNQRFKLPVTLVVFQIKYYDEFKRMLSDQQLNGLLTDTSKVIIDTTRDNDVAYYLQQVVPTWGLILYTDRGGATIAANRIKQNFNNSLSLSTELSTLNISLNVGISEWNRENMDSPHDLIDQAIKDSEYDVDN